MNAVLERIADQEEAKLALLLLRKKVITEGQLKASLDYQRSLGGRLEDVLIKLGLLRASQLGELLQGNEAAATEAAPARSADIALDPATVKTANLKLHRRLLDKIPRELIAQYLLVTFFPLPSGNSRKVILGHGREIPRDAVEKVRSILGVDLCTLKLEPRVVKELVGGSPDDTKETPADAAVEAAGKPPRSEEVLVALVKVLTRKGIITREELEDELGV
jgi:hypothetical protein